MNITANTAAPASAGASATPAAAGSAQDLAFDPALAGAPAAAAFAQWLAVGDLAEAAPADPAGAPATSGTPPGDGADADAGQDLPATDAGAALPQDVPMLAAMAMPLMTSTPFTVPLPVPAAAAATSVAAGTDLLAVGGTAPAPAANDSAQRTHTDAAPAGTAQQPLDSAAAAQAVGAAVLAAAEPRTAPAGRNLSRATPDVPSAAPMQALSAAAAPSPAPAAAAASAPAAAIGAATAGAGDAVATTDQPDVAPAGSGGWGVGASTASAAQARPADTVALAGPPQAWRQTLHEALGERLQMQVGNNLEQAIIRLDPPNLGRIEIAIRHRAGNLEVTLSATHSEVVRQLHTVSDNLRNDLAQRQYSEVAVTVSQAPRAQQQGQSSFADQQGRQRQDGRKDEESTPGQALADAGNPTSTFSLNGRE
jgi:flagellar hook-length control protein FliK